MPDKAADAGRQLPGAAQQVARQAMPLGIAAICVFILIYRADGIDWAEVQSTLRAVPLQSWGLALAATALSFWAVGRYDQVIHGMLETGVTPARAAKSGITAIAGAQTIGLGLISGSFLRWRMLPELTLLQATRITAVVAVSFLAGWAVFTAGVILLLPPAPGLSFMAAAVLAICILSIVALLVRPRVCVGKWQLTAPPLRAMFSMLCLAALDTAAASAALHALLPPGLISFGTLLPVFLLALGAGLLSGAPAGIGPFELTMLSLLPVANAEPLVASLLAFRMVYYAMPALLAAALAAHGVRPAPRDRTAAHQRNARAALPQAGRAETGLWHQGQHRLLPLPAGGAALVAQTPQAKVMLFDPFGTLLPPSLVLSHFQEHAKAGQRWPALYKCGARMAATARRAGWAVQPVAEELWLCPAAHRSAGPEYRQLRRKLRKAEASGVVVSRAGRRLPLARLGAISAEWASARQGERGFSMGRYAPGYLAGQRVYLAHHQGDIVGFASFHLSTRELALDLMRHKTVAPDGTLHALVQAAITDAAAEGCDRLSLAAVPLVRDRACGGPGGRLFSLMQSRVSAGDGLRQFKLCFAPRAERLYVAAPGPLRLMLIAADIGREIARPAPLPASAYGDGWAAARKSTLAHADHDRFEFASGAGL